MKKKSKRMMALWIAVAVLLVLWIGQNVYIRFATPEPRYEVLQSDGRLELRQYPPLILAQVEVDASNYREAGYRGFMALGNYIFGDNTVREGGGAEEIAMTAPVLSERSEKIAMTAPVLAEKSSESIAMTAPVLSEKTEGNYTLAFVMPDDYQSVDDLPLPNNKSVQLVERPERKVAAVRFSGFASAYNEKRYTEQLLTWLDTQGLTMKGQPAMAYYDPPSTLPFLRRNEVMVEVE